MTSHLASLAGLLHVALPSLEPLRRLCNASHLKSAPRKPVGSLGRTYSECVARKWPRSCRLARTHCSCERHAQTTYRKQTQRQLNARDVTVSREKKQQLDSIVIKQQGPPRLQDRKRIVQSSPRVIQRADVPVNGGKCKTRSRYTVNSYVIRHPRAKYRALADQKAHGERRRVSSKSQPPRR